MPTPTLTQITDTLYLPNGALLNASCVAQIIPVLNGITSDSAGNSFTPAPVNFSITNGVLSLLLTPNDLGNPSYTKYRVHFFPIATSADTAQWFNPWVEDWFVPTSAIALPLRDIRIGELGWPRTVAFSGALSVTVPGALFSLGLNIPIVRTFDLSGNEFFGGPITRDPISKDITVTFMHAHSGSVQLFLTGAQYRKSVTLATSVSIPYSEHGLKSIAGWCCIDAAGNYKLDGVTIQSTFGGILQTLVFKFSSPFSGTLVILGA